MTLRLPIRAGITALAVAMLADGTWRRGVALVGVLRERLCAGVDDRRQFLDLGAGGVALGTHLLTLVGSLTPPRFPEMLRHAQPPRTGRGLRATAPRSRTRRPT